MEEQTANKLRCVNFKNQQISHEEKKKNLELEKKIKIKAELEQKLIEERRNRQEAEVINIFYFTFKILFIRQKLINWKSKNYLF